MRYRGGTTAAERADVRAAADATLDERLPFRIDALRIDPGDTVTSAIAKLERDPDVLFAQPDYEYAAEAVPNDPLFSRQWALNNTGRFFGDVAGTPDADIDAPEAWNVTLGSDSIAIGVIDSGLLTAHPDIAPSVYTNPAEASGAGGVDDDGNGFVDDVHGFDFFNDNGTTSDDTVGHGSFVASVVGARGGNGLGMTGVAQRTRIVPLQAVDPATGKFPTSAQIEAIGYARQLGLRVVNMSLGGFGAASASDLALRTAFDASPGIFFTTSAGNKDDATGQPNDNDVQEHWPSQGSVTRSNVISVASSTNTDTLSPSSSYGATTVDLAAPGDTVLGADDSLIFQEMFDHATPPGLATGWATLGTWGTTSSTRDSVPNSLTDSPPGNYNATLSNAVTSPAIPVPSGTSACTLSERSRRSLESGDVWKVKYAYDGSGTYQDLETFTSSNGGFAFNTHALPSPAGHTTLRVRYELVPDGDASVADGVYVDDVRVSCTAPAANAYRYGDGTSFSTPAVAGTAVLMLAANGTLTPGELKSLITGNVDVRPGLTGKVRTNGRLNADAAVRAAQSYVRPTPPQQTTTPAQQQQPPPVAPPAPLDLSAPLLAGARVSPARFAATRTGATFTPARAKRGARLTFTLDEPATMAVAIVAKRPGRRVGRACRAPSRKNRKRRKCTRRVTVAKLSLGSQPAGAARVAFSGRVGRRALGAGAYDLQIVATDAAGNASSPATARFKIVRP